MFGKALPHSHAPPPPHGALVLILEPSGQGGLCVSPPEAGFGHFWLVPATKC